MNTKHTPGPWTFGSYCNSDGTGHMFICTNTHRFGDEEAEICRLALDTNEGPNARLIAAAPELLAALIECEALLARIYNANGLKPQEWVRTPKGERAAKAIAKATGQQ